MSVRNVLYFAVGMLVIALSLNTCVSSCLGSWCGNDIVSEKYSPDNAFKVVVFTRSCGATTGFSTQVTIIPANAALRNEAGTVFRGDFNGSEITVTPHWSGNRELRISIPDNVSIYKKETVIKGVQIIYENRASDYPATNY